MTDSDQLRLLYGAQVAEAAAGRIASLRENFRACFGKEAEFVFSAPGRTEIGGNHTDHQLGCVLAASVDLDALAAVRRVPGTGIRLISEGHGECRTDYDGAPRREEAGTTAALIRGMTGGVLGGRRPDCGLEVYVSSRVPAGSGLSSSAAFEILIGTVLNELFRDGSVTAAELARIGQRAENIYFGKPSGLLDQMACAVGSAVFIDFGAGGGPLVRRVEADPEAFGYKLCIIYSGAGHEDLTDQYAAIPAECRAVAACFGKRVLREVPEADFLREIPELRRRAGDRAVLRALHFYGEDRRACEEAQALERKDFGAFLRLVRESGLSSAQYLQNIVPAGAARHQELMVTLALAEKVLAGEGAVRVHGGGFGGTA